MASCPKQLLYVPFSPATSAEVGAMRLAVPSPTERAKDVLAASFAPGADKQDCSICMEPVVLRPPNAPDGGKVANLLIRVAHSHTSPYAPNSH